jgi:hypothetical protein
MLGEKSGSETFRQASTFWRFANQPYAAAGREPSPTTLGDPSLARRGAAPQRPGYLGTAADGRPWPLRRIPSAHSATRNPPLGGRCCEIANRFDVVPRRRIRIAWLYDAGDPVRRQQRIGTLRHEPIRVATLPSQRGSADRLVIELPCIAMRIERRRQQLAAHRPLALK